jgi:hypothetical protein
LFDRVGGGLFPGFGAGTDQGDHIINAIRHVVLPLRSTFFDLIGWLSVPRPLARIAYWGLIPQKERVPEALARHDWKVENWQRPG